MYAKIAGTGSYLPEKVLSNQDLEKMVETSDAWIRERTGIAKRHIAAEGEFTVDLATAAAKSAIAAAGIEAESIDLIVVATTTADKVFPSTACLVQQALDIHGCPAFDVQAVCAGFVYALGVADKFLRTGSSERALVIGAETFSRIIDWTDRDTCVLFGDGAGAVILERSEEPGILSTHLHADGKHVDLLHVPKGISQGYSVAEEGAFVRMQGNKVFRIAVTELGNIVDETLAANGMEKSDVDWLVPHQANIRIIEATARKLNMSMEKVPPIAFPEAAGAGCRDTDLAGRQSFAGLLFSIDRTTSLRGFRSVAEEARPGLTHLWCRRTLTGCRAARQPLAEFICGSGVRVIVLYPWRRDMRLCLGRDRPDSKTAASYARFEAPPFRHRGWWYVEISLENLRLFYVQHLLYHEVGHHIDWYFRHWTPANLKACEEFADQYAFQKARTANTWRDASPRRRSLSQGQTWKFQIESPSPEPWGSEPGSSGPACKFVFVIIKCSFSWFVGDDTPLLGSVVKGGDLRF